MWMMWVSVSVRHWQSSSLALILSTRNPRSLEKLCFPNLHTQKDVSVTRTFSTLFNKTTRTHDCQWFCEWTWNLEHWWKLCSFDKLYSLSTTSQSFHSQRQTSLSKPRNFKILNCQTNFVEACDDSKESSLGIHSDGSVHVVGERSLYFCLEFGQRNISVTGLKV